MHVFVGLVVDYAVIFGLMKLATSPKLGVPVFWITFLGTAFWSAVFSPWAKAEERRNQQAAYERWRLVSLLTKKLVPIMPEEVRRKRWLRLTSSEALFSLEVKRRFDLKRSSRLT